jgi:hypothetical protein
VEATAKALDFHDVPDLYSFQPHRPKVTVRHTFAR